MANAGSYQLLINDGQQDGLLNQKKLLQEQLHRSAATRRARGDKDPYPTIADVQATHVLFTKANWKPFAPLTSDYNASNASAGSQSLGSQISMEVPMYGDFIADMHIRLVLKQPTLTVDAGVADEDAPAMRWCQYPGERVVERIDFTIVSNNLDELHSEDYMIYRKALLSKDKEDGWARMMGQERAHTGYARRLDQTGSGVAAQDTRTQYKVFNGLQTPSGQKSGDVELLIPVLMWFADVRLAIPGVALPHGQRFLTVKLAPSEKLVSLVPRGSGTQSAPNGSLGEVQVSEMQLITNNLFTTPNVHEIYVQRLQFTLMRVHVHEKVQLTKNSENVRLSSFKWPIEYFFAGCRRTEVENLSTQAQHQDRYDQFTYATPLTAYASEASGVVWQGLVNDGVGDATVDVDATGAITGINTLFQTAPDAADQLQVGDILRVGGVQVVVSAVTSDTTAQSVIGTHSILAATTDVQKAQNTRGVIEVNQEKSLIDWLTLQSQGNTIFHRASMKRFNSYFPWHYGKGAIRTPEDEGLALFSFARYPGAYQPSGSVNLSRARETDLIIEGSTISQSDPVTLFASASAINFTVLTDGALVRRFA